MTTIGEDNLSSILSASQLLLKYYHFSDYPVFNEL